MGNSVEQVNRILQVFLPVAFLQESEHVNSHNDRYTSSSYWMKIHQSYEVAIGDALAALAKACND